MKISVEIGLCGENGNKTPNKKWQNSRLYPKTMIGFLAIAFLTFGLFLPDAFADSDPLASGQNPFAYSIVSASHESMLSIHSVTLYLSGRRDLPTTVFLPTVTVRKIGMDSPKGWTYESRTTNTPVYRKRGDDPTERALTTEIVIVALPKARKSDLVILDGRDRIFLLHLVPRPKMIGKIPFYSRNATWWAPSGSFSSTGLQPLPTTTGSISAPSTPKKETGP